MFWQGGSGDKQFLASALPGEWHFVSLSYDHSHSVVAAYIDGQRAVAAAPGTVPTRSSPLFLGASSANLLNAFCGYYQDVRVYNRPLAERELRFLWAEMSDNLQVRGDGQAGSRSS